MTTHQKRLKWITIAIFVFSVLGIAGAVHALDLGRNRPNSYGICIISLWALLSAHFGIAGSKYARKCKGISWVYLIQIVLSLGWIALLLTNLIVSTSHGVRVSVIFAMIYALLSVLSLVYIRKIAYQEA